MTRYIYIYNNNYNKKSRDNSNNRLAAPIIRNKKSGFVKKSEEKVSQIKSFVLNTDTHEYTNQIHLPQSKTSQEF